METKKAGAHRQLNYLNEFKIEINNCSEISCLILEALTTEEPTNYNEAKGCPNWERAMQEEIEALNKNETWELAAKPEKCVPVTCKWVYRFKKRSYGTIDRFKASLVACGLSQNYRLDYEKTFNPVVN